VEINESQIDLSWTTQTGMNKTVIRWRTDTYPTSINDGFELFNGSGTSTNHTGLNPGDQVFYSVWGWSESGMYSLNYQSDEATTLIVNHAPDEPILESPINESTLGSTSTATLKVTVNDSDGDTMDIAFYNANGDNLIGTLVTNVSSGEMVSKPWSGLSSSTTYHWYAIADDGEFTTQSPTWSFTTKSSGSGGNNDPPENDPPTADASASDMFGIINTALTFDGSLSSDSDGNVISYRWDFENDGSYDTSWSSSSTTTHSYSQEGEYSVKLQVEDNDDDRDTDVIEVTISSTPNNPPSSPDISGSSEGMKNTLYEYTVVSTDEDNDTIQYIINWGDGQSESTGFFPSGTSVNLSHNWSTGGIFTISVKAYDSQTESGSTLHTILIDALRIAQIGYLFDTDSDGTYDMFLSDETGEQTEVGMDETTYLINSDEDSKWDYTYNSETGVTTYYEYVYQKYYQIYQETPGFEVLSLLAMMGLVFIILRRRK